MVDVELEAVHACPLCDSGSRQLLHSNLKDRIFCRAPGSWSMYKCENCGSGYLDPRPREEDIGHVYDDYYTHRKSPTRAEEPISGHARLLRQCDNSYLNWKYGTSYEPASRVSLLLARSMPNRRRRLDAKMRHLPRRQPGMAILDFGCGNGDFLIRARDAGWKALGVDFDSEAVEAARDRGLDVRHGGMDALPDIGMQFDVVTLSHVIEHVHQPRRLIESCFRILKPGGILWVETPNMESQGHYIYGQDWRGLEPPRHLVLFTPLSLTKILVESGFRFVEGMPEHPVLPGLFLESEALRSGVDLEAAKTLYSRQLQKKWNKLEKRALSDASIREFITLRAIK